MFWSSLSPLMTSHPHTELLSAWLTLWQVLSRLRFWQKNASSIAYKYLLHLGVSLLCSFLPFISLPLRLRIWLPSGDRGSTDAHVPTISAFYCQACHCHEMKSTNLQELEASYFVLTFDIHDISYNINTSIASAPLQPADVFIITLFVWSGDFCSGRLRAKVYRIRLSHEHIQTYTYKHTLHKN